MKREFKLIVPAACIPVWLLASCACEPAASPPHQKPQVSRTEIEEHAEAPPLDLSKWRTVAEETDFKATSNYDQTLAFLRRMEERADWLRLSSFGISGEGREMPLVVVSKDRAFTPAEAKSVGKPIILIQNGIHSGEIDGKDACLMILRDLLFSERQWILDAATLLIIPIYNVDGHERISPLNRPNQNGPVQGMGFRTTARGLDLNRDHLKVVSPEARALARLFNEWRPDFHADNHVTDGSDHDWVLTHVRAEAPQIAEPIHNWLKEHMPRVAAATEKAGHRNGPYVWLNDENDPSKGFNTGIGPPRFSTSYFALRNRPSVLVEMHSYKPYKMRVLANRDFLIELIEEIGGSAQQLMDAVRKADEQKIALGGPNAPPSDIVLQYKASSKTEPISFPIYKSHLEPSIVSGKPLIRYESGVLDEKEVPWGHEVEPDVVVARPRGYLVLGGWPEIEERLAYHGLKVQVLKEAIELDVETIRLSNPKHEISSYQGEIRMTADVARGKERRSFPAGTLWIPADQPDFEVAAHLLEPEAPDSLVQWGMLRSVVERKEYIEDHILDDQAKELIKDPKIAEAWRNALADKKFAQDERARYMWWYQRTKYWDERVGLLPAMRVMIPPDLKTEPWKPAFDCTRAR
jgi:hypothetical protein